VKRFTTPLMALFIFALNIALNEPLFLPGEMPFRGSIESGYVGMARFLSEHPNPWGWNPLPYCGLPTQFMYVPNMPYLGALFIHLLPYAAPDHIFRCIISLMTCLGPVTLFFFALYFTGSRKWAFIAGVAYSCMSPSYVLFPAVEKDHDVAYLAWRVKVMSKYGEGPHNTGLMLLPFALIGLWRAATGRGYPRILASALLLAVIPLTNWVAAFGLAISCLMMLLAALGERGFSYWRAFAAAALAYLLASFWLTPSFVKTILFNWPVDSYAYKVNYTQRWLIGGMLASIVLVRLLFWLTGGSFYLRLIALGTTAFGWISTVYYIFGFDTVPESHRYAIEFEFFCALFLVEGFRLAWHNPKTTVRLCTVAAAAVMLYLGLPQAWTYATQGWNVWRPSPPQSTLEYQLADWIRQHPATGRVFATCGMRYRLDAWFDIPQVGGGFETGLEDRIPVDIAYHIRVGNGPWRGHEVEETMLELKSLGTEYVVVHGPNSREYYRDFYRTQRISSTLPAVFHIEDDIIYHLPVRSLAHLLRSEELPAADPVVHPDSLQPYVAAIEDASRPLLTVEWHDTTHVSVSGPVPLAHTVELQVSDHPGWQARQNGHPLHVEQDKLGFIVVRPVPGESTRIDFEYRGTREQRVMALVSLVSWIAAFGALAAVKYRRRTPAPQA